MEKDVKSADELRQIFKEAKMKKQENKIQVEDSPYMAEYNQWLEASNLNSYTEVKQKLSVTYISVQLDEVSQNKQMHVTTT